MFWRTKSFISNTVDIPFDEVTWILRLQAAAGAKEIRFGIKELSHVTVNRLMYENIDVELVNRKRIKLFKPIIDDSYYIVSWY